MADRPTTEATFDSRCPVCDELIFINDLIAKNNDDEWCHADCVDD